MVHGHDEANGADEIKGAIKGSNIAKYKTTCRQPHCAFLFSASCGASAEPMPLHSQLMLIHVLGYPSPPCEQICFKWSEYMMLHEIFHCRASMHRQVYTHK